MTTLICTAQMMNICVEGKRNERTNKFAGSLTKGSNVRKHLVKLYDRKKVGNIEGMTTLVGKVDITLKSVVDKRDNPFTDNPELVVPRINENNLQRCYPRHEKQSPMRFTIHAFARARMYDEP